MAVTFAVGAVTGTVLTFEFGLLWPRFMGQWGEAFGVPFGFEGCSSSLRRSSSRSTSSGGAGYGRGTHFWTGVPVVIAESSAASRSSPPMRG
jgi:cytochrome d ubiquinol oxidase subunit I